MYIKSWSKKERRTSNDFHEKESSVNDEQGIQARFPVGKMSFALLLLSAC